MFKVILVIKVFKVHKILFLLLTENEFSTKIMVLVWLWTCFYLQPRVWITAQGQQWRWYSHAFSCYNTVFMVDFEQKFAHKNKEKLT